MPRLRSRFKFPRHDEQLAIKYLQKKAYRNFDLFPVDGTVHKDWKKTEKVFEDITGMSTNWLVRRSFKIFQIKIGRGEQQLYNQDQALTRTLAKEISMMVVAEMFKNNVSWAADAEPWVKGFITAYINVLLKKFSKSCKERSAKEAEQIKSATRTDGHVVEAPITIGPDLTAMGRRKNENYEYQNYQHEGQEDVKSEPLGEHQAHETQLSLNQELESRQERRSFSEQNPCSLAVSTKSETKREERKPQVIVESPRITPNSTKPKVKEEGQISSESAKKIVIDLMDDSEDESNVDQVLASNSDLEKGTNPNTLVQFPTSEASIAAMLAENESKLLEQTLKVERLELAVLKQKNTKLNELLKMKKFFTPDEPGMSAAPNSPPTKRERYA